MPDPSSAPMPGDHDHDPTPAWPLAEGSDATAPDTTTPAIHDEPPPPADGLVEPTSGPDRPDDQTPPPADGVEAPTTTTSQAPPPTDVVEAVEAPAAPPQPSTGAAAGAPETAIVEDEPTSAVTPAPADVVEAPGVPPEPIREDSLDEDSLDEIDSDDDGGDEPVRRGGLLTKEVKIDAKTLLALVGVVVLVGVAFAAYKVGQRADDAAAPRTTSTTAYRVPADFVLFNDPETGVKLSIPGNWERRSTVDLADKSLRLVAGIPNTNDSVSLRTTAYSTAITAENLNDQKNVVDGLLGGEEILVLVDQTMTLRGLPALFYVYRFTDEVTGTTGIHAHFFVYQGRKMVSMVFQALPEDRYKLLAGTFDAIAETLEVTPGDPPAFLEELARPAASTTTAPATTGAPATTVP